VYAPAVTLAYHVVTTDVPNVGLTPRIEWEEADDSNPCPSADALLRAAARKSGDRSEEGSKLDAATAFLEEELAGGPVGVIRLLKDGREQGHAEKTLRRAKEGLGVLAEKTAKGWTWRLPDAVVDAAVKADADADDAIYDERHAEDTNTRGVNAAAHAPALDKRVTPRPAPELIFPVSMISVSVAAHAWRRG
jgi:hypothetical protein